MPSQTSLQQLQEWLAKNDFKISEKVRIEGPPFRIIAEEDIEPGTIVGVIPKDNILSIRNTAIAHVFEEEGMEGEMLPLVIATMYERALGTKSPFYGYLQSLTKPDIPLFWNDERLSEIRGTELYHIVLGDRDQLKEDYQIVVDLMERYPEMKLDKMTIEDFYLVFSFVVSRAFQADEYHGEALVPFADLFNHKTDGEHVHLEADAEVCANCGSVECDCGLEDFDEEIEQESVPELEEIPEVEPQLIPPKQTLDMTIVRPVKKGEEVFNTYGEHGNTFLMRRYGFAEEDNPYSYVAVEREDLLSFFEDDRIEFWDQVGSAIVQQIIMEKGSEDEECEDGCCDHDHEGHSHEGHDHGDHEHGEAEEDDDEEWEDEEEHDEDCQDDCCAEDDEIEEDDFALKADGTPSFELLAFLTLLTMPAQAFEKVTTDIEFALNALLKLHDEPPAKGQKTSIVQQKIKQWAEWRLKQFPEIKLSGYNAILVQQEHAILLRAVL
ncbi:hypothetical protein EDD86DRAFT_250240 [Gorgonomyces haynaldii]|nr:hypothetical protein EDD86DRAFT_250240 [Gorgonomyces haynaldii]